LWKKLYQTSYIYENNLCKISFFDIKSKTPHRSKLIIGPKLFFHKNGLAAQSSPELIFHIIKMSQDSSVSWSVLTGLSGISEGPDKIKHKLPRGELRRCVHARTRAMCGRTCACACEKTSKTGVRCACVRVFLSWSHTTHVQPHFKSWQPGCE
jgi:hypothetical protein